MLRRDLRRAARAAALALALALVPLAAAQAAATAPTVTTGGAANVTFSGATLTGTVDPNGAVTTYQFQYGTTIAYGSATPLATVSGNGPRTVTADISGLAPVTVYHYRLIAKNRRGLGRGHDRTFKTRRQPLGVTFTATPNPIAVNGTTTFSGQLTGTGSDQRQVVLESNPFPYSQGFKQVESPVVTDASGNFTFGLVQVGVNTQFRVRLPDRTSVVSPIVVVNVRPRVTTHVSTTRVRKGGRVRFSGVITPALDGTPIAIQKLRRGQWVTVAGTAAHHRNATSSAYRKTIRVRRGGTYRVYLGVVNGAYIPNTGRSITIHVRR
jgi:hypothetical protein